MLVPEFSKVKEELSKAKWYTRAIDELNHLKNHYATLKEGQT